MLRRSNMTIFQRLANLIKTYFHKNPLPSPVQATEVVQATPLSPTPVETPVEAPKPISTQVSQPASELTQVVANTGQPAPQGTPLPTAEAADHRVTPLTGNDLAVMKRYLFGGGS